MAGCAPKQQSDFLPPRVVVQTKVVYVTVPRSLTQAVTVAPFKGTRNGHYKDHHEKTAAALKKANGQLVQIDDFCEPYRQEGLTDD